MTLQATATPIRCEGDRRSYLEIVETEVGIRIQRSEHGKRALNDFWVVWLRDLLLNLPAGRLREGTSIERDAVAVSWEGPNTWLISSIQLVAAPIRPVPFPPLRRKTRWEASSTRICWSIDDRATDSFYQAVKKLVLPIGATVSEGYVTSSNLWLFRRHSCPLPAWMVALSIEKQLALACKP